MSDSSLAVIFQAFADELTEHQDRRERIIKASRDLTTLSKRLIFLLQRASDGQQSKVFNQDKAKKDEIIPIMQTISNELAGHNYYLYRNQYSPGMQEYVEAVSLLQFIDSRTLLDLHGLRTQLPISCSEEDYLLGLADLTGELMRFGLNSVGSLGLVESVATISETQAWVRKIRSRLSPLSPDIRHLGSKLTVMDRSLRTLEGASYALALRGNEYKDYPDALKDIVRRLATVSRAAEEDAGDF